MRPIIITVVDGKIVMTPEEFKKHMDDAYSQGYSDATSITSTYGTNGSNWWQRLDPVYCTGTGTASNACVKSDA